MFQVHSNYWPAIHGSAPGEVLKDIEGLNLIETMAKNMAYLIKVIDYSKGNVEKPKQNDKVWMNFIRD